MGRYSINGNKVAGGGRTKSNTKSHYNRPRIPYVRSNIVPGTYAYYWNRFNDIIERFISRVLSYYANTGYDVGSFKPTIKNKFDISNGGYAHRCGYLRKSNEPVTPDEKVDMDKALRQYRAYSRTVCRLLDDTRDDEERMPPNVLFSLIDDSGLCMFTDEEIFEAAVAIHSVLNNE